MYCTNVILWKEYARINSRINFILKKMKKATHNIKPITCTNFEVSLFFLLFCNRMAIAHDEWLRIIYLSCVPSRRRCWGNIDHIRT